jgi:GMP synthase-like glutamine amidotransferase
MKVLVIMHNESEGPGTLGDYLESIGANIHIARLYAGDHLPKNLRDFNAIVTMGGPMNVYEEEKYPFLREETIFLQQAIVKGFPILGICLGAQMIAKASGASVYKAPAKELGWSNVSLTEAGRRDILFRGLPKKLKVFQWHEDTFDLPTGGLLLATSNECPNQAFRYRNAYGLQFHVEVTRKILLDWFADSQEGHEMVLALEMMEEDFLGNARRIYANFVALVEAKR